MKKLIPAYAIAFTISYMLFIYEPLTMYANNINDFWFDIFMMLKPLLTLFFSIAVVLSIFYTIVFLINNQISKKLYVYKVFILIGLIVFLGLYIQGNFLIKNLPGLDGTTIEWNLYKNEKIISAIMWGVVFLIITLITLKFKYDKTIYYYTFIVFTIFFMLTTSLVSSLIKPDVLKKNERINLITKNNINKASTDKNFFIFVTDSIDSVTFEKVLEQSKYKDKLFNDFTFYPDTMGAYAYTRESIPFILSGVWNENEESFNNYFKNAMNESKLFDELIEKNYSINIFQENYSDYGNRNEYIDNLIKTDTRMDNRIFVQQLRKYILFKYLPYQLKKYSNIETMNFSLTQNVLYNEKFYFGNIDYYYKTLENKIEKTGEKIFNFTHIEGAHVPFNFNEEMQWIPAKDGTYEKKLLATLKIIEKYINRLKENDVYDNSVIIIMSDHGYNPDPYDKTDPELFHGLHTGRQNPMFLIKGMNERHDEMIKSDKPISYTDLQETYKKLLEDKKTNELFNDIDYDRTRRFLLYKYTKENHMEEYQQTGKAWDENTLVFTGKCYDLK